MATEKARASELETEKVEFVRGLKAEGRRQKAGGK
jgi:hypothetical protein